MDNHKAALWCWFQHLDKLEKVNIFHIDRHTDTLYSRIEEWKQHFPDMWNVSLEEYLNKKYHASDNDYPVIRFDNYLSLFLECYPKIIENAFFATHEPKDEPRFNSLYKVDFDALPFNLDYWLKECGLRSIVNIDLDYFFFKHNEAYHILPSDEYLKLVFSIINKHLLSKKILVLTISLSPEYCGGWDNSVALCSRICKLIRIDFTLPN
jgi:hypothetical protein